jgi:N-methylhydantoinase A
MGNEVRYELYDLSLDKPEPLVPRHWRRGVEGRVTAQGEELRKLDLEEIRRIALFFIEEGVRSLAVCLLHSYRNPAHENQIQELLKKEFPHFHVSLSSRVNPEIREYERTSTTVANAYVQPLMEKYLKQVDGRLKEKGFRGQLYIMLSSGGITSVQAAEEFPIRLCESGPAAGALVSAFYARAMGTSDLISFDMGGTTAKICLIQDGKPSLAREFEAARIRRFQKGSGLTLKIPAIEMIEIGAGGGSIGHVDRLGLMKVGPESAGASPGPACYGLGGEDPTVTDAALILGYLNPDYFLGGEMPLRTDLARKALKEKLADPLGITVEEAAMGINRIVTENMATATRIHIAERGNDPRKFDLIAFGGAGPIHAFRIAEIMRVKRILCPAAAGAASALGLLVSPLAVDFVRSYMTRLEKTDWDHVNRIYGEMEREARDTLTTAGADPGQILWERTAEMRYAGQFYEIASAMPPGKLGPEAVPWIVEDFFRAYDRAFGRHLPDSPIQVLTWRLRASCPSPALKIHFARKGTGEAASGLKGKRKAYFPEQDGFIEVPVYDRYSMAPGTCLPGPVIVEERECTTVVGFHSRFQVDPNLNLIVDRG